MSGKAKVFFLIAFLLLVTTFAIQIMTGLWINLNSMLLGLAAASVVVAIAVDAKMYWEFLTMRTTKHGMNMGAMIVVVLVLLICVNYLANLHNYSWDVTQEKLNSLSDQSLSVMNGLKDDIEVKVFTKGAKGPEEKQKIKQALSLYSDYSSHVKVKYINPYVDNAAAMQYLNDLQDREVSSAFMFVERGGKRVRVDAPFDEAAITSALIKATRQGVSKVYFIKGHGEKDIETDGAQGLRDFARSLEESSIKAESLNLIDKKEIPKDAAAIAIVGPAMQYLDSEVKWLREYMDNGGRLFMALDPGQHNGLAGLAKDLGIDFENNYVVTLTPIQGGGPAMIIGSAFDPTSEMTKSFPAGSSFTILYLVSEVTPSPDKPASIQTHEILKTDANSFTMVDLHTPPKQKPVTKPISLAVESAGKMSEQAKNFASVVFGDSDFVSNQFLMQGANRDLGLNAIAALLEQKDLISIRPKLPKGTMMTLTAGAGFGIVILGMSLPLLLLIASGVIWFRRRGA